MIAADLGSFVMFGIVLPLCTEVTDTLLFPVHGISLIYAEISLSSSGGKE
jgi:hypothetical protein